MRRRVYISILLLILPGIIALNYLLDLTVKSARFDRDELIAVIQQSIKNGLETASIIDVGDAISITFDRHYRIDKIPRSNVRLELIFRNCTLDESAIAQLFDRRCVWRLALFNCEVSAAGLLELSKKGCIEECKFESCTLSGKTVGELKQLGGVLELSKCDAEFTLAASTCIGSSSRVFLNLESDYNVQLQQLAVTQQLSINGGKVIVNKSFARSEFVTVLNFTDVKTDGASISNVFSLPSAAFIGITNCSIDGIKDIGIEEGFSEKCLVYASGNELIAQLQKVLPPSVSLNNPAADER